MDARDDRRNRQDGQPQGSAGEPEQQQRGEDARAGSGCCWVRSCGEIVWGGRRRTRRRLSVANSVGPGNSTPSLRFFVVLTPDLGFSRRISPRCRPLNGGPPFTDRQGRWPKVFSRCGNISESEATWTYGGIACALALTLWAGASFSSDAPADRASWQEKYRRPAEIPFPEGNAYSEAKFKLGRMLFFDPILSGSEARACASCHNPGLSWADGLPRAIGEKQATLPLRTPDAAECRLGRAARLGRTLPQSRGRRLRSDLGAQQYEYAGEGR